MSKAPGKQQDDPLTKLAAETLASVRRWVKSQGRTTTSGRNSGVVNAPQFSSARPDGRDPRLVGQDLDRFIAGRGWQKQSAVAAVTARWAHIVGDTLAAHVVPEAFDTESSTLTLRADSGMWATQIKLLTADLITKIDAEIGSGVVGQIEVFGPSSKRPVFGFRSVKFNREDRN